jgi:hypothetical protein
MPPCLIGMERPIECGVQTDRRQQRLFTCVGASMLMSRPVLLGASLSAETRRITGAGFRVIGKNQLAGACATVQPIERKIASKTMLRHRNDLSAMPP